MPSFLSCKLSLKMWHVIYIYINKSTFFLLCGDDILGDVPSRGFEWRPCSSYYVCTYTFVNMTNLHKIGVYIYIYI